MEGYVLSQLGIYIKKVRKEKKITQSDLSAGICSNKGLSKIEQGEWIPDYFSTCSLLDRLGISNRVFEYILSQEEYEFCRLRHDIEKKLYEHNWEEVRKRLLEYQALKKSKDKLHQQYIFFIESIVEVHANNYEVALERIEQAIEITIQNVEIERQVLGVEEMRLLLHREYIYQKMGYTAKNLMRYKAYIEDKFTNPKTLVLVYPQLTVLIREELVKKKEFDTLHRMCKKSMELLNKSQMLDFMYDILQIQYQIKDEVYHEQEKEEFLFDYKIFIEICEEWNIISSAGLFARKIPVEIDLDWEIIQKERIAKGMTQEELASNICEPETISRIESSKRRAHRENYQKLQEKLEFHRNIVEGGLITDDIKLLEWKLEIMSLVLRNEVKKARELLYELSSQCDLEDPKNMQFYLAEHTIIGKRERAINDETGVRRLQEALGFTKQLENGFKIQGVLSSIERIILNSMAIYSKEIGEVDAAIQIWRDLLHNIEEMNVEQIFHHIYFTIILYNLAKKLEEMGELEEAKELCEKGMEIERTCGRSDILGFFLCELAEIYRKREEREKARQYYRKSLTIFKLVDDWNHYRLIKKAIKEYQLEI